MAWTLWDWYVLEFERAQLFNADHTYSGHACLTSLCQITLSNESGSEMPTQKLDSWLHNQKSHLLD